MLFILILVQLYVLKFSATSIFNEVVQISLEASLSQPQCAESSRWSRCCLLDTLLTSIHNRRLTSKPIKL